MEEWSLTFTILSFIIACLSLWKMWSIARNTSIFSHEQATKESENWNLTREKIDNVSHLLNNLGTIMESKPKIWTSELDDSDEG